MRAACAWGVMLCLSVCVGCGPPPPPPNIVLYVVDTLRADALAPYGNPVVSTPAVARLAREGVLFERAYAHSSWTRPSITSILTGQLPDIHGVELREQSAPESLYIVAEALSAAGYATGAIVTNPNVGSFFGFDQGYDDFVELFARHEGGVVQSASHRARSDKATEQAIAWIDSVQAPFFLYVLTSDPHSPYDPPPGFDDNLAGADPRPKGAAYKPLFDVEQKRSKYYGEVEFNDASFGRLLEYLRESGRDDQTLVVFTADHGEEFGEHGHRWHGKTLFDEQLRVPLVIRRPGEPEPGRRVSTPVGLVDVHATLLDAAGLSVSEGSQGQTLPPAQSSSPPPVYASLQLDDYSAEMVLAYPWKWISSHSQPKREKRELGGLFNLESDPFEATDRRSDYPDVAAELRDQIERRERAAGAGAASLGDLVDERELPPDVREGLEVLGYLEPEEER